MPTCIIGDIHGRADHFRKLLDAVQKRFGEVEYVCVGDYIDRGPDSKEVVELVVRNHMIGVFGNHETWMVDYLLTGEFASGVLHPMMGARPTVDSYAKAAGRRDLRSITTIERELRGLIPPAHQEFFQTLRCAYRLDIAGTTYWVSHGGLKVGAVERIRQSAGVPVPEELLMGIATHVELESILWEHSNIFPTYEYEDGSVQVYGHCPIPRVESTSTHIALDTGSGRTTQEPQVLSAVVLTDDGARHIITDGKWLPGGDGRQIRRRSSDWTRQD